MGAFYVIKMVLTAIAIVVIGRFLMPYMRRKSKEVLLPEGFDGLLLELEKQHLMADLLCLGSFALGVILLIFNAFGEHVWRGFALVFASAILLPVAWLFLSMKIPRPRLRNLLLLLAKLEKVPYSMAAVLLYVGYLAALAVIVGYLP